MRSKIVFALCFALLLSFSFVLYVGAEPTTSPPSDLSGYTVNVPSGWIAPSGYGNYNIEYIFNSNSISSLSGSVFGVGFTAGGFEQSNSLNLSFSDMFTSGSFSITITGGSDSSSSSLIRWLSDNNATFDDGSQPETFPIAGGFYAYDIKPTQMPSIESFDEGSTLVYPVPSGSVLYLNEAYNVDRGSEIPIKALVIQVANIVDPDNYHIKVGVWYSDDIGFVPENVFTIVCSQGLFTKVNRFSFSRFYFPESFDVDEWGFEFFNSTFTPSDQPIPVFEGSPLAYIIGSINDALRVDIFGSYSIMDITQIFVSLSLLIWILKMIAGG